jgi:hypothetical protein
MRLELELGLKSRLGVRLMIMGLTTSTYTSQLSPVK